MAKIIFRGIESKNKIRQAARLIHKHLSCRYRRETTTQAVYGDGVTQNDLLLLRKHGYKVKMANKAK